MIENPKFSAPLIFVHYGVSPYLPRTFRCAVHSNPAKRIIFIGDRSNRSAAHSSVEFFDSALLEDTREVGEFGALFQPIQGERHTFSKAGGITKWLRFVFLRWFFVSELLRREAIENFWIFDSDTLLLAPLAAREKRFSDYETTTQCRDCCLNGLVGSRELVERYTKCMLSLFGDQDYLDSQRERLKQQPGLAFNEMDAFCEFRRRENVRTFHAAQPLEGEFFDDALAYDANFEASPVKVAGRIQVKRLWCSPDGALYARHLASGRFVRMITCNLSWLPDYVWKKLTPFCLTPAQDAKVKPPVEAELREIDLSQPLTDMVASVLKKKAFEMRRAIGMG